MKIKNFVTNTNPLVAHSQGTSNLGRTWLKLEMNKNGLFIDNFPINDVTILTFASINIFKKPLIEQLTRSNIPFVNCAEGILYWENRMKIPLAVKYLDKITSEYCLILDAEDVLLANDCSEIIEKFKSTNYKILFGSTVSKYPNIDGLDECSENFNGWNYLNAGTSFGKTKDLFEFYLKANFVDVPNKTFASSEQYRIKLAAKNDKNVGIDNNCVLFQTLNKTVWNYNFHSNLLSVLKIQQPIYAAKPNVNRNNYSDKR